MRSLLLLLLVCFMFKAQAIEPYEGVFRVGAATKVGTFFKAASEMCDLMNRHDTSYCVPVVTNGSLHNLNLLLAGKLDMAIVKSDVVLALDRSGMSGKSRDRVGGVQVIARLHPMPLSVIGREDGPDTFSLASIRENQINIGLEGSGERIATQELFRAMDIAMREVQTTTYNSRQVPEAFCHGETDIVIELIAHPAIIYDRLINDCGGKLLHIDQEIVRRVSNINPHVAPAWVYEGFYTGDNPAYETYAVHAVLIANDDLSDHLKAFVTDSLDLHFLELQQALPEWIDMSAEDLMLDQPPEFVW